MLDFAVVCAQHLKGKVVLSSEARETFRQLLSADTSEYPELFGLLSRECPNYPDQFDLLQLMRRAEFGEVPSQVNSVAQFYFRAGNGGAERVFIELSKLFLDMDKRSVLIMNEAPDSKSYPIDDRVICRTICNVGIGEGVEISVKKHIQEMALLFEEESIDAYINHAWLGSHMVWDLLLCRLLGVRHIVITHNVFSHPLSLEYAERECFSMLPYVIELSDGVDCLTSANAYYYSKFNDRTYAIPNPVSDELLLLRNSIGERQPKADGVFCQPTILWFGRFCDDKRPEDALEIMAMVKDSVPGSRLVLVGSSDDGNYESLLRARITEFGLENCVDMPGFKTDVSPYLIDADIFLFTTQKEGYPMVLIEASAAGLPTVMYDLPYLSLSSNEGIARVPLGDKRAAADKVIEILRDEDLKNHMNRCMSEFFDELASFDQKEAWGKLLACSKRGPNVFEQDDEDALMWQCIFDHSVLGYRAMDAKWKQTGADLQKSIDSVKKEYEQSLSFRLGRTITALPRKLNGKK